MNRIFFLAFFIPALFVFVGCALDSAKESALVQLAGNAEIGGGLVAIGTLASIDTTEFVAAPAWTKLAAYRLRAATLLKNGKIGVQLAQWALNYSNRQRARIELALQSDDRFMLVSIARELDSAIDGLEKVAQ